MSDATEDELRDALMAQAQGLALSHNFDYWKIAQMKQEGDYDR